MITVTIPIAVILIAVFVGVFHLTVRAGQVWIDAAPDAMPRPWWTR